MKEHWFVPTWMLVEWLPIFVFAFLKQPYWLTVSISILVIKQLGRINSTLKGSGDER